ncbi:nucleotidyltransferase domain-containing protein [Candidatus Woesearchaeota archaeon]|nr:nucleotidyltransferase domain-containing protein [Candidatus Woesearchaeota archaeon]
MLYLITKMLTKTDVRVLELFTSKITTPLTIREVSKQIQKDLHIVHQSIKKLQNQKYLMRYHEKHPGLILNYKTHRADFSYIESLRAEAFLKRNASIRAHMYSILAKLPTSFYSLIIFGSYASGKNTEQSDIDLLVILPRYDEAMERSLTAILSISVRPYHLQIVGEESVHEMLAKREELNVMNETPNNHIILYGAEQFYKLLGERDVR